ncbi:MAG: hypothetical protein HQL25_01515 [Candidatus Omnitrophica bacterium]|nr:hypothetical protein [Candidatus Omnitrophota bacterium]
MKHKLGGVFVEKRAEDVGLLEKYKSDYAFLCNFSHMTHFTVNINDANIFKKYTFLILQEVICYLHDVGEHICNCFNLEKDIALEKDIISFSEACCKLAE